MKENRLGCNVYVDANIEQENFTFKLANFLTASINGLYIENADGYVCVDKNDEFNLELRMDEDDGFLYYHYLLEVEPSPKVDEQRQIGFVSKILEYCWSNGYPAVASCDYEDKLPNKGGYKSLNIPQPQ